ncbi:MAG: YceI family protein [Prosthecobacter sp.]|uniref:YceI family protein n=1 Tax=Prosthecobacter sp. TaxID=1965333 RepID=UPI003BB19D0C
MKTLSITELQAQKNTATLIHVLPEEHFACAHLPGAINACVYETIFPSKVAELIPDKNAPLIVYGAGGDSLDATTAAEKLTKSGYTNVAAFTGGIAEWKQNNLPLEGTHSESGTATPNGQYNLDTATSVVRWTGRSLFNHHHGTLKLASGHIEVQNGILQTARFTLDMNSIACEDLVDTAYNAMLIRHLRDDDFFAVDRFPTAEFICDHAAPLPSCTPGTPNYTLHGTMTLRGVTKPLSFPAVIAAADADNLTGQAQFELDRTQFGSHYGSGRLFAFLGKHVVNDHVHLHIKLHATRNP